MLYRADVQTTKDSRVASSRMGRRGAVPAGPQPTQDAGNDFDVTCMMLNTFAGVSDDLADKISAATPAA